MIYNMQQFDKLQKLEKVESKYGIQILDVVSAIENGFYDVYGRYYEPYVFVINLESSCIESDYYEQPKHFDFEDFGKTWYINEGDLK